jgi:DnaJ-class molecular chaperone
MVQHEQRARQQVLDFKRVVAAEAGKAPGDLYVVLQVTLPSADSEDAKHLYEQMQDPVLPLNYTRRMAQPDVSARHIITTDAVTSCYIMLPA